MGNLKEIIQNLNLNGKVIAGARLVNCFLGGTGGDKPASAQELASLEAAAVRCLGDVAALPNVSGTPLHTICKLTTDSKRYILAEHATQNITVTKASTSVTAVYTHGTDKTVGGVTYTGWATGGTTRIYTLADSPAAGDDVYTYASEAMSVNSDYTIDSVASVLRGWEEL